MEAVKDFEGTLKYKLDAFQEVACEALAEGMSVLVAAPTGSGKTTVAEFAIWLARSAQGKVVYTSPIKALSNQKFGDLKRAYGEEEVGLLTGDVNINSDAPILVMTTEVLRNMIYEESSLVGELTHVILDEVHYLADRFRGAVWEEIILHLPGFVRLVCLSATVSNAEEFGDWLEAVRGNTKTIVSEVRPVPLFQHVFVRGEILPLFVSKDGEPVERGKINRELVLLERNTRHQYRDPRGRGRRESQRLPRNRVNYGELIPALHRQSLLPGIVFIFSRTRCDDAVQASIYSGVRLTTAAEQKEIRRVALEHTSSIAKEDLYALRFDSWLAALERGVAAHHAGLIPPFKQVVEILFQRKLVKLVFATETLALGINMPAKSVVIEQLSKFNGESEVPLSPGEFTQLTGRAGRRGIDVEGHAIIAWEHRRELDRLATLASKRVYPLKSSFKPTYNMAVNLLNRLDMQYALSTLERSFAQFQVDRQMVTSATELRAEENSYRSYLAAADKSEGEQRKRWLKRARDLKKQIRTRTRYLERRTGTIARMFERLVGVLIELDYLSASDGGSTPTAKGEVLRTLYGERDLLVSECIDRNVWAELNPVELAAMCATLVYEPRREDDYYTATIPHGSFAKAYGETIAIWEKLDSIEESARLPRTMQPHPGIAPAIIRWARGKRLETVLEIASLGPGDFIRVTKLTIDLLDQIYALGNTVQNGEIDALRKKVAAARDLLARGIVEASSKIS